MMLILIEKKKGNPKCLDRKGGVNVLLKKMYVKNRNSPKNRFHLFTGVNFPVIHIGMEYNNIL